ncbi:MAG: hypothetical protein HY926_03200 [Elusimicrobia bacterium]|nr:hypothetical protein [Elusimicrobiota bacterium]
MNRFFERNKKKGLVGLLYLIHEKKKVVTLVFLAVAGTSGFMMVQSVRTDTPWPAPIKRALQAVHLDTAGPDAGRAVFSSKAREDAVSRIVLPGSVAGSRSGVVSTEMVQGGAQVLQARNLDAERLGGKTVQSVRRPENAGGVPPAIPLSEAEMKSGLARGDAAAVVRAGEAGQDEEPAGTGPDRGPDRGQADTPPPPNRIMVAGGDMGGARAVDPGPGGLVQRMTDSQNRSLGGGGSLGRGGQLGRLSAFSQEKGVRIINAWNAGAGPGCDQGDNALCELVVARASSRAGKKSLESCASCPKESGTHMAATSFDGKSRKQAGIVTSSEETPPSLDGQYVDALLTEGDQFYDKINHCDDVVQSSLEQLRGLKGAVLNAGAAVAGPYETAGELQTAANDACAAFNACMSDCPALCAVACLGAWIYAATRGAQAYIYQMQVLEPKYQDYADACSAYNSAAGQLSTCDQGDMVSMFRCRAEDEWPKVQEKRHWQFLCGG